MSQHVICIDLEREDDGVWSVGSPTSETLTLNNRVKNAIAAAVEKNLDEEVEPQSRTPQGTGRH